MTDPTPSGDAGGAPALPPGPIEVKANPAPALMIQSARVFALVAAGFALKTFIGSEGVTAAVMSNPEAIMTVGAMVATWLYGLRDSWLKHLKMVRMATWLPDWRAKVVHK